jgi:hypothetical protein
MSSHVSNDDRAVIIIRLHVVLKKCETHKGSCHGLPSPPYLKLALPRLRPLREDVEDEGGAVADFDRGTSSGLVAAVERLLEVTELTRPGERSKFRRRKHIVK